MMLAKPAPFVSAFIDAVDEVICQHLLPWAILQTEFCIGLYARATSPMAASNTLAVSSKSASLCASEI